MHDRGLLADSADDSLGADGVCQFAKVRIVGCVFADDCVLDPREQTVIHQFLCGVDFDETVVLDVQHGWL